MGNESTKLLFPHWISQVQFWKLFFISLDCKKKKKNIQLTVNKLYITLSGLQLITVELLSGFAVTYSFHNDNLLNP